MHQEENVIKKLHPHPLLFLGFYLGGPGLAVVGFYLFQPLIWIGIMVLVLGEVVRRAETFYVTDDGVVQEYKFLSTFRKFAEYRRIQNIEVRQSFFENIFGIGNVHFDTAGADKTEVNFHGISDPYRVEKIVRERISAST